MSVFIVYVRNAYVYCTVYTVQCTPTNFYAIIADPQIAFFIHTCLQKIW